MDLTSEVFEVDDFEKAVELCYEQRWTDGLPVIPPTRGAIERVIEYLGRRPADMIGVIPPANRVATIENIAVNSVMAGCKPEYVPFVIAAIEAMLEERFNLNGVQTTTHNCAPLVTISGPGVKTVGFNTREGSFGHGCRASASIGRAVRLILWNVGGGYPGEPCKTTLGHPGYYSFCVAEDQDSNPWEPTHVESGFAAEDTVVTVTAAEAPHSIATGAGYRPAADVLYVIADAIAVLGSANVSGGEMVLVLGPMAAKNLADAGLGRADVKRELMRLATRPVREVKHRHSIATTHPMHWSNIVDPNDDEARVPFIRGPENLVLLVSGGWGSGVGFSALCPGWGALGGYTVRRRVEFPRRSA
ncbi:MAG TPA: hypothetical protein VED01_14465 [Burkholderiales bacterium]|nr:hypothetical protein [Burkholderiales bacterium]